MIASEPLWREEKVPSLFDLKAFLEEASLPFVFLESSRVDEEDRRSLFFAQPIAELVWSAETKAEDFFRRLEAALAEGFWLAGFFTYEVGYLLERRLAPYRRLPEKTPLAWFGIFKSPRVLPAGRVKAFEPPMVDISALRPNLERDEYLRAISKIKDFIASGDTYQVNYTFKYHFLLQAAAKDLYLALRPKQRVRYGALIETGGFSVVSLSPELFLRHEGERLWTSPMKGTAPRGRFPEEDEEVARWLAYDPKNQAENVMIVDLLRNDLGRVCVPGSVYVRELFKVERYETVFQMISTVEGKWLARDLFSLFKALFPCGSVTGAPKIRTMEIIAALEKEPRGVYTGALGYFSPQGDFVFNVPIRTVVLQEKRGEFGLGSGIVWDSDPQKEYEECLLKARFLLDHYEPFFLVETMRFSPEEGFPLLDYHLRRLRRSAGYFDFPFPEEEINQLLSRALSHLSRPAKVRLLLAEDGSLKLEAYPLEEVPLPVKIALAKRETGPEERFLYHKTTYRPWYLPYQRRAKEEGLFEIVFFDEKERITEGTITNFFWQKGGRLYTPPLTLGLLPGVLRTKLLEEGRCEEKTITIKELASAEAIYVGNAVRGLLPVGGVSKLK